MGSNIRREQDKTRETRNGFYGLRESGVVVSATSKGSTILGHYFQTFSSPFR